MKTHNYDALDAAIIEAISANHHTQACLLKHATVITQAKLLVQAESARPDGNRSKCEMRFLDSRLQALRKNGKIRHENKNGWQLVAKG